MVEESDTPTPALSERAAVLVEWYLAEALQVGHPVRVVPRLLQAQRLLVAWSVVKSARQRQKNTVLFLGEPSKPCGLLLTPAMQKTMSEADRNTTGAALEWMSSRIGEQRQVEYLLNDLIFRRQPLGWSLAWRNW